MDFRYYVAFISEWLGAVSITWLLSISPRFRRPPIGFKYPRRDGLVALSLYGLILIFAFIFYSTRPAVFPEPLHPAPAPVQSLSQALLVAGLVLLPFLVALAARGQPPRSAGWNPALFGAGLQVGFAVAVLTIFLRNRVMDILGGLAGDALVSLLLALGISLAEETVFRGYIQLRMMSWLGPWQGLVITAIMSTLWHVPAWLYRLPQQTTIILVALTFIQALVLGWMMRKTGHVIAPVLYRSISIWMQFLG